MNVDPANLLTVKGLAERFLDPDGTPLFPEATVRSWTHSNMDRFKDRCVIKPGGKVFVDLEAFSEWLQERRGAPSIRIVGSHRAAVRRRQQTGAPHPVRLALEEGRRKRRQKASERRN